MRRLPTTRAVIVLCALVVGLTGALLAAGASAAPVAPPGAAAAVRTATPGAADLASGDAPGATTATTGGSGAKPVVLVVSVNGLIDPIVADLVTTSLDDAARAGAVAVVLQVDLEGAVIAPMELYRLLQVVRSSRVPTSIWVGPTSSELVGGAAHLAGAVDIVGMAPGTRMGDAGSLDLPINSGGTHDFSPLAGTVRSALATTDVDARQAEAAGIATFAPTIGDFIVDLPGVETKEIQKDGQTRREPVTPVVFTQLPLGTSFLHTFASPAVAYLLLTAGLALLIFELYTAGVGVAGVCGALSFVAACYGLANLPTHWYGIALVAGSMVALAVDVQTGVPRVWTGIGLAMYTIGSLVLYDGVSMSWLTIGVGIVAVVLAFVAGMPSMVRTRFSTPTIGREWMIGELGRAVTDVRPDGVVEIRGAQWRAYTNRATPIEQLDRVRVVGIEGLVLEVEPEEGGARDYRERS